MNVQYIDIFNKMLVDHREMRWVQRELSKQLSEIEGFKRVFKNYFGHIARLGFTA